MPECFECGNDCGCDDLALDRPSGEEVGAVWERLAPLASHLRANGIRLNTLETFLRACEDGALGLYVKPWARRKQP